ncbi:TetR family transcriptional regulator [Nocardia asteroides]|uniref:TetR family transcriptional regulator n=1 Tax=Nocardia asteroides TaxID=1824 RepID=UPI001E4EFF25|nr:TetR family transcriptional regulator [Nocardia asteroides]UGT62014.1 TetR family transcriptional regulator [Nocardia asteroides]
MTNSRTERAESTKQAIVTAAEALFAEHGIGAVSHRQIATASRQGNNAAVAYHFGTKADLVAAIHLRHAGVIEQRMERSLARMADSTELADWIDAMVRGLTDHLAALGTPSWYARFCAQAMADPVYADVLNHTAMAGPALNRVVAGMNRCLPELPQYIVAERHAMTRLLLNHTCADYEAGFAEGREMPRADWESVTAGLVDAMVGLWCAPHTVRHPPAPGRSGPPIERTSS